MSELRWNILKRTWSIITTERGRRPRDYLLDREKVTMTACPFCYGREEKTTPEIFAIRPDGSRPNGPGWRVRVIPNKYPALHIEGELDKRSFGLYDVMNGIGAHEVIIENPDHERSMAEFSQAEILNVLRAYRSRLLDLRKDPRFRHILIFKNHGIEAGAGIPHSYSQVIAVPLVPPFMAAELSVCREYFLRKERCLMCDMLAQEEANASRLIRREDDFLVFAPYASAFPFEMCIAPRRHSHDFCLIGEEALARLAATLRDTLQRLRSLLRDPPFNFILHNAPPMHLRLGKPGYWGSLPYDFHWHIELVPRLIKVAGFEWGTGLHINPTPPEEAARSLRDVDLTATS